MQGTQELNVSDQSKVTDHRPWGSYTILEEGSDYKVKSIRVHAAKRLSYQKHSRRSEHWIVVQGIATITLDGKVITLTPGETVDIPVGTAHRVENSGEATLVFIEVQRGDYFGEDDIVRIEDDFGRAS